MPRAERNKPRRPLSQSEKITRDMARSATKKSAAGKKPTASELAALRRVEKQTEEARRWEYYETIPKRHWQEMSGRPPKVLNEQDDRYGIPLRGKDVSLPAIARWLHNFLADNARIFSAAKDDPLMGGPGDDEGLRRYRLAKADLAELELARKSGELRPADEVNATWDRLSMILRGVGDRLQREFGPEARAMLDEGLDNYAREVKAAARKKE